MGNIIKSKVRKPRSLDIRVAHTLAETITTTSETTQRVLLLAANMAHTGQIGENRLVRLAVGDIHHKVGGEAKSIYRAAKRVAKELRSLNYYISDNGKDAFVNAAVVAEDITLAGGFFEFTFTKRAIAEIGEVAAKYTLLHCRNVKRCAGGEVTLYMLLARWDSAGEVTLVPDDFPSKTAVREPLKHQERVIDPFVAKFNALGAKIGLNMRYTATGRGKKRGWKFEWLPRALHKLGDIPEDGDLGLEGGYSAAAVSAMRTDMFLRRHGVFDKSIPRLLAQLPPEVAADITRRSCDEAPHKPGVINKLIKGEIFEYLDGNTAEQIAARRQAAQKIIDAVVIDAQAEVEQTVATDAQWLAAATDVELEEAASQLRDCDKRFIQAGETLRQAAERDEVVRGIFRAIVENGEY